MNYGLLIVVYKAIWSTIPTLFCASIPFATETSFIRSQIKCNSFQEAFLNLPIK